MAGGDCMAIPHGYEGWEYDDGYMWGKVDAVSGTTRNPMDPNSYPDETRKRLFEEAEQEQQRLEHSRTHDQVWYEDGWMETQEEHEEREIHERLGDMKPGDAQNPSSCKATDRNQRVSGTDPSADPRHLRVDDISQQLGVVHAAECGHLRLALVPGLVQDRRDLGVGHEGLPAIGSPVEEHPDAVGLDGIAKDGRTLRTVLPALVGPGGREDLQELVEILDLSGCQHHVCLLGVRGAPAPPQPSVTVRLTVRMRRASHHREISSFLVVPV